MVKSLLLDFRNGFREEDGLYFTAIVKRFFTDCSDCVFRVLIGDFIQNAQRFLAREKVGGAGYSCKRRRLRRVIQFIFSSLNSPSESAARATVGNNVNAMHRQSSKDRNRLDFILFPSFS